MSVLAKLHADRYAHDYFTWGARDALDNRSGHLHRAWQYRASGNRTHMRRQLRLAAWCREELFRRAREGSLWR